MERDGRHYHLSVVAGVIFSTLLCIGCGGGGGGGGNNDNGDEINIFVADIGSGVHSFPEGEGKLQTEVDDIPPLTSLFLNSNTNLNFPLGIAVANGQIFVADLIIGVMVFDVGDDGDVAPRRIIPTESNGGQNTGLVNPFGVAVANSEIFVADVDAGIVVFDIDDDGDVIPQRLIPDDSSGAQNTKLKDPCGIAVADGEIFTADPEFGILVFDIDDDGDVLPQRLIPDDDSGAQNTGLIGPLGIEVAGGKIFVADETVGVVVFNIGDGDVEPQRIIPALNNGGQNTGLVGPSGIAVANGKIFVADSQRGVVVFNVDDDGDVEPRRFIPENTSGGQNTELADPSEIAVAKVNSSKHISYNRPTTKVSPEIHETARGIEIIWREPQGISIRGYHVWRKTVPCEDEFSPFIENAARAEYEKISGLLIPAVGKNGKRYTYLDWDVPQRQKKLYFYKIEYIDFRGKSRYSRPVRLEKAPQSSR